MSRRRKSASCNILSTTCASPSTSRSCMKTSFKAPLENARISSIPPRGIKPQIGVRSAKHSNTTVGISSCVLVRTNRSNLRIHSRPFCWRPFHCTHSAPSPNDSASAAVTPMPHAATRGNRLAIRPNTGQSLTTAFRPIMPRTATSPFFHKPAFPSLREATPVTWIGLKNTSPREPGNIDRKLLQVAPETGR